MNEKQVFAVVYAIKAIRGFLDVLPHTDIIDEMIALADIQYDIGINLFDGADYDNDNLDVFLEYIEETIAQSKQLKEKMPYA